MMRQSTKYLKILCNFFAAALVLLFLFWMLPRILAYFAPFVFGFIFSMIANPLVRFLEKKIKIKRKYGSALMIVLVIGVLVLICYGIISVLAIGLRGFSEYLPTMYENAGEELNRAARHLQELLNRLPFVEDVRISELGEALGGYVTELMSGVGEPTVLAIGDIAMRIPDILVGVIVGLLATYFFIADRDRLTDFLERHLSRRIKEHVSRIYQQLLYVVGGYFKAQFKIMGVIYVVVFAGLVILQVKYAWLIAFGIAFLDMLPVFGTGTVLCPWAVIKLFSGNYAQAFGMLALYGVTLVVHQLVQPKLVGESVGMDPFAALFFMYVGYQVSSVAGMILAIPIGMILINLYRAGAFDTLLWCVREVVRDFNRFRQIPQAGERGKNNGEEEN